MLASDDNVHIPPEYFCLRVIFFPLLLWLNYISLLQHIPSLYVEALTPSSQTMALLGDGVFTGVIEVK